MFFKKAFLFMVAFALLFAAMPGVAQEDQDAIKTYEIQTEAGTFEGPQWEIPYVYTFPIVPEGEQVPAVIMLHGTGSDKNEAGNGYVYAAEYLASLGIANIRIDFAGSGDSDQDYINYTLTSGMDDANAAINFIKEKEMINPNAIGIMGWSQGGTVAMLTASRNPEIKSMVTWAGAIDMSFYMADQYETAIENGYAEIEFDWREPLKFSKEWFEEVRNIDIAKELNNYHGALLAVYGSNDDVVPPSDAEAIINAAGTAEKDVYEVTGADHTFNIFSGDMTAFSDLITVTVYWFLSTL